jgi:argininosuccinate lyase
VKGSIAYAKALEAAGCITAPEREVLVKGLLAVLREFEAGEFEYEEQDEDIHTAVERRLSELVGPVAGKLHTGRSRNDQVATDLRLYLLEELAVQDSGLRSLQGAVVAMAEGNLDTIMPGYTHLQHAQPLLFSHWLMSFFWKFERDRRRLEDALRRIAVMPLGAGAIAGNPFEVDREALAADLGFEAVAQNSVDAVGDRDFVVETLVWAALLQVHLSELAETLIVWSTSEFAFVVIDEGLTTGSSLMPQKRNPDVLELFRAKSGRITGHVASMLCALKGLPSGYNKDLQEDKEALFDTLDTLRLELPLAVELISTLRVNADRMGEALDEAMLATDLADYLVRQGVPFRESHHLVGRAVKLAEDHGLPLSELQWSEYQSIDPRFAQDLYEVFDFAASVGRRATVGGTARSAVEAQVDRAKAMLGSA